MIRHRRSRPRRATLKLTAAFATLSLTAAPGALAAPGDLDSAFGTGGVSLATLGSDDYVRDVAIQADGKTVAAGASWDGVTYRFALARYNSDGSLDTTFSSDGKVVTTIGSSASINGVALQPDGKIVAVGRSYSSGSPRFALARYNSDGSLDTSFSGDGLVTTTIGSESSAWDVVLEPDGRIDVAGHAQVSGTDRIALARYTTAGTLDSGFGAGGVRTTLLGTGAYAFGLARLSDGRLVTAGGASEGGVTKVALARYTATGSLDTTFGSSGSVLTSMGTGAAAGSLLVDSSGRLVVAGTASDASTFKLAIARYSSAGTLDGSFGTGGVTLAQVGNSWLGAGLAQQSDGRLVVAGDTTIGTDHRFALTRVNTDGSLDSSFGTGGSVTTAIGTRSAAHAVAVQADGLILAAGTGGVGTGARQFALARYVSADPPPSDPPPSDPPPSDPPPSDPPPSDPPPSDPPPSDPPPSDPPPSDPPPSDPPPSEPPPSGGNGQQVIPIDELGLLPPDVKPIVMPQQALKLQGTNLLPIRLRCVELPTVGCKGTVVITAPLAAVGVKRGRGKGKLTASRRRKAKMVRIARRKVSIPSGQDATLTLQLSGAAQRALELNGSLRIQVTASMEVGGEIRASRRNFTLRKPKKKGKRRKSRR